MGEDVHYSGTVAAAIEGTIMGVPAIAASMTVADPEGRSLISAGKFIRRLVTSMMGKLPPAKLLNVNFPKMPRGGYRAFQFTRLGRRVYTDIISSKTDPAGRDYFWIGGEATWDRTDETDAGAVARGKVSITPLNIDMTDRGLLEKMRGLSR
jgi:5'-nucleotidase